MPPITWPGHHKPKSKTKGGIPLEKSNVSFTMEEDIEYLNVVLASGGLSKLEPGLGLVMAEGGIEGVTIKLV
ncbi:unnamed protein product, partial [Cyprideis torosa]